MIRNIIDMDIKEPIPYAFLKFKERGGLPTFVETIKLNKDWDAVVNHVVIMHYERNSAVDKHLICEKAFGKALQKNNHWVVELVHNVVGDDIYSRVKRERGLSPP